MLELGRYEQGVHTDGCGFHGSLTKDLSNHFTFEDAFCPVCKGAEQHARMQTAEDERLVKALGEKPDPLAPRPMDGRRTYIRMMTAAEVEQRKARNGRARG